ncbi:MAG: oligoendopeptidase F [Candidatus Faecivicinus sp.]
MELKSRAEMDPRYTWDLTPIFESDDVWETALKSAAETVDKLSKLPGTLDESLESFKAGLDAVFAASEQMEKLYCYAYLRKSGDNGDPVSQDMEARCIGLMTRFQAAISFLNPEILAMDPGKLASYMADARMATYRHLIDDICRARSHTLDAEREKMLAMLSDAVQTPSNVYDMFESVDMTFEPVTGENGEELPLTHGSFAVFRESRSREVRREAFEKYFGAFEKFINTISAMYAGSVKFDCYFADVRGYSSACEAALFGNNVPVSLYDNLVATVSGGLDTMKRYLDLRKRVLGVDELHLYDLYVPIVDDIDFDMPYDKACRLVREALKPLGEEYGKLLDRAFAERWIDVYENKGKTTGAYSMGVYGAHPYVLLNHADTLDSAFTLAHELGHALHSFHSDAAHDYVNHDYCIFVAEVASTVNEVLLTKYLLKTETDPKRRAYILNHFLEGFRTTVFRQTQFAEFERKAHEMHQSGIPLTAESLNRIYRELNAKYYEGIALDGYTDCEWARIPHFYRAFYVYQYSTGFCSAVTIADRILNHGGAADYLRFLSTGGSDYPIEELKIAGVDLTKPDALESAMRVFAETMDEMEQAFER